MLAYLFWHRPRAGADAAAYVEAQRAFHDSLEVESASFELAELPFDSGPGYEDWYLVDDWDRLGTLNESAVDARRRASHDRVAAMAGEGWGGVYSLLRGSAAIPGGVEWLGKRPGEPHEELVDSLPEGALWQRQMVLGPAPEFGLATASPDGRRRV